MATYVSYYHGFYSGDWNANPSGVTGLFDGDTGDTQFTLGETLTGGIGTVEFAGTFVEGGNLYLAAADPFDPTFFFIFSTVDPAVATLPPGYTLPVLNTAAFTVCFAPGTHIDTPSGGVAVEALAIGDLVMTADGRAVPVKWIGRQTVSTVFGPPERRRLVRVRAGALGDGLPLRDLVLTADHALLVEGMLVNAGALVNGAAINWEPLPESCDTFTVFHVETEKHDIILAEGAPAETFIDYVGRQAFDNYAEYVALYGEDRCIPEMPYPRISSARMVPERLKAGLAA